MFLVLLRMSIGWHLMYEGLWKIQSQKTAYPWSAEGYLKNAIGPMRTHFRDLTGDPNDFRWLDYDRMVDHWEDYRARFLSFYGEPEDGPTAKAIDRLLNGAKEYAVPLAALPEGFQLESVKLPKGVIRYENGKLIVDGKQHLLPSERDELLKAVPLPDSAADAASSPAKAFHDAVNKLFREQSKKLGYKERLAAALKGDPDRVGILVKKDDAIIEQRMGDIELYKKLIDRYEEDLKKAKQPFQFAHLDRQWGEIQDRRRKLVGPIQSLDREFQDEALELLSPEQFAKGPVPKPSTQINRINTQTMWGLTIIGILLIAGLATRPAAVAGLGLLTLFYLAAPPWPGVPEVPGPEHNFIVNKLGVEIMALLALVFLPTGSWFGMDALFSGWWARRRNRPG